MSLGPGLLGDGRRAWTTGFPLGVCPGPWPIAGGPGLHALLILAARPSALQELLDEPEGEAESERDERGARDEAWQSLAGPSAGARPMGDSTDWRDPWTPHFPCRPSPSSASSSSPKEVRRFTAIIREWPT